MVMATMDEIFTYIYVWCTVCEKPLRWNQDPSRFSGIISDPCCLSPGKRMLCYSTTPVDEITLLKLMEEDKSKFVLDQMSKLEKKEYGDYES